VNPIDKKFQIFRPFLLIFFIPLIFLGYNLLLENTLLNTTFLKPSPALFSKQKVKPNPLLAAERRLKNLSHIKKNTETQNKLDSINSYLFYTGTEHLSQFVQAISSCSKDQVRIGYFGDSSIEGDLISMTIRTFLQKKFGGNGVGFVPITSLTSGFRSSISHSFSDNWDYGSIIRNYGSAFPYGISGEVFYVKNDSLLAETTQTASVKYGLRSSANVQAVLFYGKQDTSSILPSNSVSTGSNTVLLNDSNLVNTEVLGKQASTYALEFSFNRPQAIYGVSFASSSGIIVDNFALRSNSGGTLSKISSNYLKAFNQQMDFDLIILQYGLNILSDKPDDNYLWYKTQMSNVIQKMKIALPNASFLLVSIGDKSEKNDQGVIETQVNVEKLVALQKDIAIENNVSFFNMYEAMGGKNSMVVWVETNDWANKDYTHFNYKGAAIMGESLSQFLQKAYFKQFECNEK